LVPASTLLHSFCPALSPIWRIDARTRKKKIVGFVLRDGQALTLTVERWNEQAAR
jgi:hypothetical protein